MSLKNLFIKIIPLKYHLPLEYALERITGKLEPEIFILPQLIGKGELAIDVGANFGIYSYALSKLCKRVEAFEPLPRCVKTIEALNASNVKVHNVGLSSMRGYMRLYTPIINGIPYTAWSSFNSTEGDYESIDVPIHTLDEYDFKNVSFIKIDAEGHELEILRGAAETIKREKPVLLIEIEQRHLNFPMEEVFKHVLDYGYCGYFYQNSKLHLLSEFSHSVHQERFNCEGYINNFIFKPLPPA